MGNTLVSTCGEVTVPVTYDTLSQALFDAFFSDGFPLSDEEKEAFNDIVLAAKNTHVAALPIITLDGTGQGQDDRLKASEIVGAFLEGLPLNVITDDNTDPEITLNATTGAWQILASFGAGQRLFLQYRKTTA